MTRAVAVTQIDAAVDHLDWAIRLLIDHDAPRPAITLAGASEELLGKMAKAQPGATNSLELLKFKLAESGHLADEIAHATNGTRNFLKHGSMSTQAPRQIEIETEAIQYIVRAIGNLALLDRTCSSQTPRFLAWLKAMRSDLDPR